MKCHVYRFRQVRNRFILVPADRAAPDLPEIRRALPWKTVNLEPNCDLIGVDTGEAMSDIERQGYHIVAPRGFVSEAQVTIEQLQRVGARLTPLVGDEGLS